MRRVKEGASGVLLQSGVNESWWADSMECYTYLRNVTDLLSDGKTSYEKRFGQPFKGPIIPCGDDGRIGNYSKRLNAKEVIFSKQGEFIFPITDGRFFFAAKLKEMVTRHNPSIHMGQVGQSDLPEKVCKIGHGTINTRERMWQQREESW